METRRLNSDAIGLVYKALYHVMLSCLSPYCTTYKVVKCSVYLTRKFYQYNRLSGVAN